MGTNWIIAPSTIHLSTCEQCELINHPRGNFPAYTSLCSHSPCDNMQTEKDVKEPNSAPAHSVLCAQGTCRETCLKSREHRICLFLLLYRQIQNDVLESILKKTVSYVLSESNQLRQKLDVHHYFVCIVF